MTRTQDAVEQLSDALNGLASALESGEPDAVLAAEAPFERAVQSLASAVRARDARGPEAAKLGPSVAAIRARLAACHRLGETASGLMTAMFTPQTAYGRKGTLIGARLAPPVLESRI